MSPVFREEFIQEQTQTVIGVESSRVKSMKRLHSREVGIRAYNGKLISIAGGIGFPQKNKLWKEAKKGLASGVDYPLLPLENRVDKVEGQGKILDDATLIEESEIILSRLRHRYPDLLWNGQLLSLKYSASLTNDRGLDLFFSSPVFKCVFSFRHKDSHEAFDGYTATYGVDYSRERVLADLDVGCNGLSRQVQIKNGKIPVILTMGVDNMLIKHLLRDLTCSSLQRGTSKFAGRLNRTVLNPSLTVHQTCDSRNTALKHFDKEGTVNQGHSLALIEKGKPLRPITDRLSSRKFGCENSGSAFRGRYDTVPAVGLPFVRLEPTGRNMDEILQGREALLLIVPGGGGMSGDGVFSSLVHLGYLIRDGHVLGSIPPASVSAPLQEMFSASYLGCSTDSVLQMTHAPAIVCEMDIKKLTV